MKKWIVLLISISIFSICGISFASPYVVSNTFNKESVEMCVINIDNTIVEVEPQEVSETEARCIYDVGDVADGSHHITMSTKNIWGVSEPVPFDFTKELPPVLSRLSLER